MVVSQKRKLSTLGTWLPNMVTGRKNGDTDGCNGCSIGNEIILFFIPFIGEQKHSHTKQQSYKNVSHVGIVIMANRGFNSSSTIP
jgi:hypothetical protein